MQTPFSNAQTKKYSTKPMSHIIICIYFLVLFLSFPVIADPPVYTITDLSPTNTGFIGQLKRTSGKGPYGNDVDNLFLLIESINENILHLKITDLAQSRWQVPGVVVAKPSKTTQQHYQVILPKIGEPFSFQVETKFPDRKPYTIFDTRNSAFIFSDQFIQFGSNLPGDCDGGCAPNLYGLGERVDTLKLSTQNMTYTIWNHDNGNAVRTNLYGTHPFYLEIRDKNAHGVFFLNSNAMDIVVNWNKNASPEKNQITYKTIGGVIDLYFMVGPHPRNVVRQYQEIIGKPFLPPFWALGFHQCRWGYKSLEETMEVVKQYEAAGIPLETMWNDIDYMDKYKDFTFDPEKYPLAQMKAFAKALHDKGQHYIVIVDPGIKLEPGYPAYEELLKNKLYIAQPDGKKPLVNVVWPGHTVFPDFTNDKTHEYWKQQIHSFLDLGVDIDALWIDMNEPAGFCNGQCYPNNTEHKELHKFDPYHPPYIPGTYALEHKTLSLNATTAFGPFYNTHSMYGYLESIATRNALATYPSKAKQRPFVLTRSTFAGSGRYVAHWTGDNESTYASMRYSISGILSMQLFGITMVGADICGFSGDTTFELCTRWHELGSFYPFSRNHNSIGSISQEPYAFGPKLIEVAKRYLLQRYSLLQWYYTILYHTNQKGGTLWDPLWLEFPNDPNTYDIDSQFMIGGALLVSPALEQGQTTVDAYFPQGIWYDLNRGEIIDVRGGGARRQLDTPLDEINCHIRGGHIIARQTPDLTLNKMKFNAFALTVALNEEGMAHGELFLDDGITIDAIEKNNFTLIRYKAHYDDNVQSYFITSYIERNGYSDLVKYEDMQMLFVYGISKVPCNVTVNGQPVPKPFFDGQVLTLNSLNIPMTSKSWIIQVRMSC